MELWNQRVLDFPEMLKPSVKKAKPHERMFGQQPSITQISYIKVN